MFADGNVEVVKDSHPVTETTADSRTAKIKFIMTQLLDLETDLLAELDKVRASKAALVGSGASNSAKAVVKSRAKLLRDYLASHPEGIPVKQVPKVLSALGHISKSAIPATNWLYQQPPGRAFFVINHGIVKLNQATSVGGQTLAFAAAVTAGGNHTAKDLSTNTLNRP